MKLILRYFVPILCFNCNRGHGNQWLLFYGNVPGIFTISSALISVAASGGADDV